MKQPLAVVGAPASCGSGPGPVPPPPRELGQSGLQLWSAVRGEFHISDAGGVELLLQACQASDRLAALAARIEADGEVVTTAGGGLKAHPGLREETSLRSFICRTLARLGILDQPLQPVGRPPTGGLGWRVTRHADE